MALPYPPDEESVLLAIDQVGENFRTLNIARHRIVLERNRGLTAEQTYNSGFGQHLRANAGRLGTQLVSADAANARFRKVGPRPATGEARAPTPPAERGYSPRERCQTGDTIVHPTFGRGSVLSVLEASKILLDFAEVGQKRLVHAGP